MTNIFHLPDYIDDSDEEIVKNRVGTTDLRRILVWTLKKGQEIKAHYHPDGEDLWYIFQGKGIYYSDKEELDNLEEVDLEPIDEKGKRTLKSPRYIEKGDIVVFPQGMNHAVIATSDEPLIVMSILTPGTAKKVFIE
ncbi:MAG: cupin domain-containing protein [Candidatus Kariarchaeaceae archaeon]